METSVERLEQDQVKIDVTVPAADVDKYIDKAYKDIAHKYRVPGFRPGRAPRPVLESTFGKEAIMGEATNELLNDLEPAVLEQTDTDIIGETQVDDVDLVEKGKDFSYTIRAKVSPEIKLNSYDNVSISLPSTKVSDEEVEKEVDRFRDYYAQFVEIDEDRPVEEGDFVYLDIEGSEGAEMLTASNRLYEVGSDAMPSEYDENIVGMAVGEEKTFTFGFDEDAEDMEDSDSDVGPQRLEVTVTIQSIREKKLPEVDDEFAKKSFGFDSVEAMNEELKKEIGRQKESSIPQLKDQLVTMELADRAEDDIPGDFVAVVRQELLQDFFNQLQQQGMTVDSYIAQNNITIEQLLGDIELQATDTARERLAIDAYIREKNIDVTPEEVTAEFTNSGVDNPEELLEQFTKEGRLPSLRSFIRRTKAVQELVDNAEITELETAEEFEEYLKEKQEARMERAQKRAEEAKKEAEKAEKKAEKKETKKANKKKAEEKEEEANESAEEQAEE